MTDQQLNALRQGLQARLDETEAMLRTLASPGRTVSAETRRKMSEAQQRRQARKRKPVLHWTQTPEGRKRWAKIQRKGHQARRGAAA